MINNPDLESNVAKAAAQNVVPQQMNATANEDANIMAENADQMKPKGKKAFVNNMPGQQAGNNSMLAQVVGVIIGSPEFQRK